MDPTVFRHQMVKPCLEIYLFAEHMKLDLHVLLKMIISMLFSIPAKGVHPKGVVAMLKVNVVNKPSLNRFVGLH